MQIIVKGYANNSIGDLPINKIKSQGVLKKFQGYPGSKHMKKVENSWSIVYEGRCPGPMVCYRSFLKLSGLCHR